MRAIASPAGRAALAILLLLALLPLPSRPGAYDLAQFVPPPADLAVVVLALCLLPRGTTALRAVLVAALAVLTVLRLADLGMVLAFRRSFNPILDWHLLRSGWELGTGTFGVALTAAAVVAALLAVIAVSSLLFWTLGGLPRLGRRARTGIGAAAVGVLILGAPGVVPGEVADRTQRLRAALDVEADFTAALRRDDLATPDFAALRGRDVIFLFVESYGRAWLEDPAYADTARDRLAAAEARLSDAGFAARSAWFAAPTRGGQSWLAHGAVMSGLWTASQGRYDALVASDRRSLNRLFAAAGWRTAAIVPAITRDWPAGDWFGYDAVYDRDRLGYAGQPFEWVTMPDQYSLAALDRLARTAATPVMAEVSLISSHAPWTPIPDILPWAAVGDGAAFDGTRRSGASPREVWSAPETIRAAYSRALDYAVEVVAQWIARSAEDSLVVVLGDHQPAPLVAGEGASAAVPLHVVASDPALLDRLPGPWSDGLVPAADLPERSMTEIRAMFADCFSTGGCGAGAG